MKIKIQKWGNSLAVRIPKIFAEEASIEFGSTADLSIEDKALVIRSDRKQEYSLKQLVSGITVQNVHSEADTGMAMGKESW